jgi:hypothetical protein
VPSTDDLIAGLVADLRPVTPLMSWPRRMTAWSAGAALWLSLVVVVVTIGRAPETVAPSVGLGLHAVLLLTAGFGSAAVALRRGVPGDARAGDLLTVLPMAAWLGAAGAAGWPGLAGVEWACVAVCLGAAAVPGAWLTALLVNAAPMGSVVTRGLVAVGCVALGAFAAEFTCSHATGGHLYSSHAAPAAIAIAAGVAGSTMLGRSLERKVP